MPGRNIYKEYLAESYYHIYNRGVSQQTIFDDSRDYAVFLGFLKRYLGSEIARDVNGEAFPSFKGRVELLAFCLMPTHFHLLIYQHDREAMRQFMKSLSVAYSMYFNRRNRRFGPLFQQRYRASRISRDPYLLHISRYIHLNPSNYANWEWSSLPYYLERKNADWILPQRILQLHSGDVYLDFIRDGEVGTNKPSTFELELANPS